MDIIYDPIRLVSSLAMKRKALVVRNGSTPESEDVVKEQDELSSTSSVSLNSQDETHEKEADSLKTKYARTIPCSVFAAGRAEDTWTI